MSLAIQPALQSSPLAKAAMLAEVHRLDLNAFPFFWAPKCTPDLAASNDPDIKFNFFSESFDKLCRERVTFKCQYARWELKAQV